MSPGKQKSMTNTQSSPQLQDLISALQDQVRQLQPQAETPEPRRRVLTFNRQGRLILNLPAWD